MDGGDRTATHRLERVYLDNAATSWPKPPAVWDEQDRYQRRNGASAGRGGYREARESARQLDETRRLLADLLGADKPQRMIFAENATGALNLALKGHLQPGDHVVTTAMEHNSVLRPLEALRERGGITVTRVPASEEGFVSTADVAQALRAETRLIAVQHASNVSGTVQPVAEICRLAREWGIVTLVDAAQTAGSLPIDIGAWGADLVAVPGHKGLLGPLGTGALYVAEGVVLRTVTEGGTGSRSELDRQPEDWPDRHEAGSHNLPGLVGWAQGLAYLRARSVASVRQEKLVHLRRLLGGLRGIEGVRVVGPLDPERNAGVVSFTVAEWEPAVFAEELDRRFRVQARPGLHCAPGAHRALGTFPQGTVRFSLGPFNTAEQIDRAVEAVEELAHERAPVLQRLAGF